MDPENPFPETVIAEPAPAKPPRYPLTMHKMQRGKLISGHILNPAHEETAKANGWLEDPEEAKAAAPAGPTVEQRLEILEAWMAEQKERQNL